MALLRECSSATSALIISAKKLVKKITRHPFFVLPQDLPNRLNAADDRRGWWRHEGVLFRGVGTQLMHQGVHVTSNVMCDNAIVSVLHRSTMAPVRLPQPQVKVE